MTRAEQISVLEDWLWELRQERVEELRRLYVERCSEVRGGRRVWKRGLPR